MAQDIRDCIAPDRNPKKPDITLPKGAIDTHVHVFEDKYWLSPARGYNPPESTLDDLKHLHATLGVDRVVFTQPSPYGTDNSAIIDGVTALNAETTGRAKMVVAVGADITEDQIAEFDAQGACGVRLNTDNKGGMPIEFDEIPDLEAKLKPFNWHIEWLFPGKDILSLMPYFKKMFLEPIVSAKPTCLHMTTCFRWPVRLLMQTPTESCGARTGHTQTNTRLTLMMVIWLMHSVNG